MAYANTNLDNRAFVFGPGVAFMTLVSYVDGSTPTTPFPRKVDVLQEISIDFDMTVKRLFGQNVFPAAIGVGEGKVTGKIKNARFNSGLLGDSVFGLSGAVAGGQTLIQDPPEAHTLSGTTQGITPPNSGAWGGDLGVFYADSGAFLTPVASTPTTGQYAVSTSGVYTFSAADGGANLQFGYYYTVTTGQTLTVVQFVQGEVGIQGLRYQGRYGGRRIGVYLPNIVTSKFNIPTKQQDFVLDEIDFEGFAGPSGTVGYIYLCE